MLAIRTGVLDGLAATDLLHQRLLKQRVTATSGQLVQDPNSKSACAWRVMARSGAQKSSDKPKDTQDKFNRWFKSKKKVGGSKAWATKDGKDKHEKPKSQGSQLQSGHARIDDIGKAGVSKGLMQKLLATKQRLLAGNAEAARAGAVKAEPGAWSAANAERRKKPHFEQAAEDASNSWRKDNNWKGNWKDWEPVDKQSTKQWVPVVREELVALNRQIAAHAQVRDLAAVRSTLSELEGKKWANGHTYAAAVHALCRCGDWQGAEAALSRAEKFGLFKRGTGAASGLITRTSMLRGYVECARDLGKARALLERMEKEKAAGRPNVRTANTFLRGCLTLGSVHDAEAVLQRMNEVWASQKDWRDHGGKPDASTYELVVSLLCQALRYADARNLAVEAVGKLGASPGCASMFVSVARAALLCSKDDVAAANVKRARKLLSQEEGFSDSKLSAVAGSGGKRATRKWSQDGDDRDSARAKSLEVFQSHRRREILSDLKEIEEFIDKKSHTSSSKRKLDTVDLDGLYTRTLCFEDYGDCSVADSETLGDAMCRRICDKFGLHSSTSSAKGISKRFNSAFTEQPSKKQKKARRFDLKSIFCEDRDRPLHLELCSGSGEWLCSQAHVRVACIDEHDEHQLTEHNSDRLRISIFQQYVS